MRGDDRLRAADHRGRARGLAERLQMAWLRQRLSTASDGWALVRDGDDWMLEANNERVRLRDSRGLHYLRALLAAPRRDVAALECEMAEQAAWRVTDAQLVRMEAHLAYMRELGDSPDRYLDADLEFHDMILAAAGNRIAEVIMRSMHEPLRRSRRLTNQIPGGIASAQEFHEAIFEQLRQRNAAGARAAMSEHLAWSWQAYRSMIAGGPVAYSRGKAQLPTT